jgi:hypothetical protein
MANYLRHNISRYQFSVLDQSVLQIGATLVKHQDLELWKLLCKSWPILEDGKIPDDFILAGLSEAYAANHIDSLDHVSFVHF